MTSSTAVLTRVFSADSYREYNFGPEHPFSPMRLEMLHDLIAALDAMVEMERPAAASEADLLSVHGKALIDAVVDSSDGTPSREAALFGIGTPDVPAFRGMHDASRALVGGTLAAAQAIDSGRTVRTLQLGGGLHHAHETQASGFCVYNDLAVAIQSLRDRKMRVAYIDIDVHHGDGVQSIFYGAPDVMTISLHESGQFLFPGTGAISEIGQGAGRGLKLNVPLVPGTTDASFIDSFERVVPHALSWFGPDVLLVQCGSDAHYRDPLADLRLTTHSYEVVFHRLLELANEYAGGRIVLTLGGGYDFDATVRIWAMLFLMATGQELPDRLPQAWIDRWQPRFRHRLTPTLLDPPLKLESEETERAAEINRETTRQLMEHVASKWM
jgi:acetoin utilization protein AcuC